MDQKKIGLFLKELRKEQNLTQEQLAEKLNISGRTVSRWETGTNLPDLSILIELADFYDVDIREIMDGERKKNEMNRETKETLNKVAEYAQQDKENLMKRMAGNCMAAAILLIFCVLLQCSEGFGGMITERPISNITDFTLGLTLAILILNMLFFMGKLEMLRCWKRKRTE